MQARHSNRSEKRCGTGASEPAGQLNRESRPAALRIGDLDRIGQARADVRLDLHAIDNHLQHRAIPQRRERDVLQTDRLPVHEQPPEPLAAQRGERFGDRVDQVGQVGLRRRAVGRLCELGRLLLVRFALPVRKGGRGDDGHVEPNQQTCALGRALNRDATTSAVSRITSSPHTRQ